MWNLTCRAHLPLKALRRLWPAPREGFQTAQVCVLRRSAHPAWEGSTASPSASLSLMDPVVGGTDFYELKSYVIISVYYELNGWCVVFLLQILLCQGSCRTHSQ